MKGFVAVSELRSWLRSGSPLFVQAGDPNGEFAIECRDAEGNLIFGVAPNGEVTLASGHLVTSKPPPGSLPVKNLYFNPVTGKMVVEYDDGS